MSPLRHIRVRAVATYLGLLLGAGHLTLTAIASPTGDPIVTSFSNAQMGSDSASWVMTQGNDGILYFGGNSLMAFDGERWSRTSLDGSYAIRSLDFSADGRLWAAAAGELGWYERTPTGLWTFHSLQPYLPTSEKNIGEVWHVSATADGALFVAAEKIYRWDGTRFQVWSLPGVRRLFAFRVGKNVYVHHELTGIYSLTPEGPTKVISAEKLGGAKVVWMEATAEGWLLATTKGLFTYTKGSLKDFSPQTSDWIERHLLRCATRLPDGRIALGTFRGGIMLVRPDGSLDRTLTENEGLPSASIYSLSTDREGSLWATSSTHVFRIGTNSQSTLFGRNTGLPLQGPRAVVSFRDRVVAAADTGVFELAPDEPKFQPLSSVPGAYYDVQPINGALVFGGLRAVVSLRDNVARVLARPAQDAFIVRPSRLARGAILVSEGRSIVLTSETGEQRVLVRDLPDIATSVAEDGDGSLWIGTTTRGILRASPQPDAPVQAETPQLTEGLIGPKEPGLVASAPHGAVVMLGRNGGWVFRPGARQLVPITNYPQRGYSAASTVAADGTLWVAYSASERAGALVGRISVEDAGATWVPHFVEGLEQLGALRSITPDVKPTHGPALWIGGANGILRNDISAGPIARTPRAPLLSAWTRSADQESLRPLAQTLPYSTQSIVFEFSSPEFALRPSLRLETRIDGIDDRWVPADATARRELTAVRDGHYTFQVRAVAATGAVSESTTLPFVVSPPWWRTAPAMAGIALALVPFGYGTYRLRVRSLRRRNAELEEKVRQRTEQLAQASAAKTQFVANMSHDIRNPLNGIVGLALALDETPLDPRQRELVATLRECTTYLSTLVDDVLDFASIEAGRVELRPGPFAPAELLRSVVATLCADAAGRGAELSVTTDADLPATVLGDAGRIQQILVNYVSNALKYAGGNVRLSASAPADSPGEIEFAVTDEGAGISESEQASLFTKFHRLSSAQASNVKGSGLGLASCRILADLMGGSVGVTSSPGKGARFHLRLPLAVATAPAPVIDATIPNTSVLLVEDADYNAWAASAVLGKLGLTCERARTGAEAIRLFAEKRFNLVLLDRNLPDMDGTDVARQIRGLEEDGPRAILLAVTAYCTPQDRALCLQAGMDAFVGKPLTPAKLRNILIAAGRRLLTAASVHVSPEAAASVDVSLLDYISDGTEEGLGDQIERFLAALADGEARLAQASRARDFVTLGDAAHFVLSQAKLVGSGALEEAAVALEQAARSHDAFAFGEMEQRVHREVHAVTVAMRRRRPAAQTV